MKNVATTVLTACTNNGVIETMDERLKKLVIEAQQQASQTQMRQNALSQLVDEILRSRKICRQGGQPLSGIYLEIYQQLQEQLLLDVDQKLNQYNQQRITVREWANSLRDNAFKKVLDDTQLKKLALEAQRHAPNTELRQQALIELVNGILLSGRLCRPHYGIVPYSSYELIYEEAVNQTLLYICQKIDYFNSEKTIIPFWKIYFIRWAVKSGLYSLIRFFFSEVAYADVIVQNQKFTTWVNFRLDKMVLDYSRKLKKQNDTEIPTLFDLDNIAQPENQNSYSAILIEELRKDVGNMFKNEHIRDFPNANFQAIALETISGKSWKEISKKYGVGVPTLSSFFRRGCQKFAPQLQEYL